jgi:hypothetical protein
MCRPHFLILAAAFGCSISLLSPCAEAADVVGKVRKAAERSTLNQEGTKPFHLKATIAPSFERDKDSGRTGEVEIWWASPKKWKREIRSSEFQQVEVINGDLDWQHNGGDFFPEWLRKVSLELVNPIPHLDEILVLVKQAESRQMFHQINVSWVVQSGTPETPNIQRGSMGLDEKGETLLFASGSGWGGEFKQYETFHNRSVPRVVTSGGTPQVTAKIATLEDFDAPAGFFDPAGPGDSESLHTEVIDEATFRKNLLPMEAISWPPLKDGVLQGNVTAWLVVDCAGKVREVSSIVSENSAIDAAGRDAILRMRFQPFIANGIPVQVLAQLTVPFNTVRPASTETFATAREYFEKGRAVSYPAAAKVGPYTLHAEFEFQRNGSLQKGRYEDTWLGDKQWRREAWLGDSNYVRLLNGNKGHQLEEGKDLNLLRFIFRVMEPIPATDTFQESDWRIRRDKIDGISTVRVLTGFESPEGKLDPEQVRGFWFDDSGLLVKALFKGFEIQRTDFQDFRGVRVARQIDLYRDGGRAINIHVSDISVANSSKDIFHLKGHDWKRAFTDEVR